MTLSPEKNSRDLLELARTAGKEAGQNGEADFRRDPPKRLDLRAADLRGVNLAVVNLEGADLRGCDLRGCDFSDKNLRYADLRGARAQGANFQNSRLYGAKMQGIEAQQANFRGCDLRFANLAGAYLEGAMLPAMSQPHPADRDVADSGQHPLENGHDRTGDVERERARER
jgi:uncharacterized protein YjbI with pentapeptide repeats